MKYIAKRVALIPLIMLGTSFLSFSLLYFAPGGSGYAAYAIIESKAGVEPTYEAILNFIHQHNLEKSFFAQYTMFLYRLVHLDLGVSLRTENPVLKEFIIRFPATFILTTFSMLIALIFGITVGILCAIKRNTIIDSVGMAIATIGISIPSYWIALLLILFFVIKIKIFPCFGYASISYLILPSIALSLPITASIIRVTRASMLDVLRQDYILAARAKGLSERIIILKHALKNALIPIITIASMQFGHLLGGAVIIESIFAFPGVGKFFIDSIFFRDYPVVAGFVLIISFFFALINLLTDLIYALIDPRVRYD